MGERIVGLDVGTSAVRAVEVIVDGDHRPVLQAYGQVGLRPGVIVDGEVQDQSQVVEALHRLWEQGGFKTSKVRLGVAGLRAIIRETDLPPLPPGEVDAAVALQAEDLVPFPANRTALSSSVVAKTVDEKGEERLRVLVAAAHRDVVDGIVAAVEAAGLEPETVDLGTAALSRAFTLGGTSGTSEAIVSVGAGLTLVIVQQGGRLDFVRTIDRGGDTATQAVAATLDMPNIDAEMTKRDLALAGDHDPAAVATVAKVVTELASEIEDSIRYYSMLPGRGMPSRVLMTGGGAQTPGLLTALRSRIEVPVTEASPLEFVDARRLHVSEEEAQAMNATVAVPLGLTIDGATRTHFDLLPPEVRQRRVDRHVKRMLVIAGIGVALVLAAASGWRVLAVRSAENQVATLRSTVHTINTVELPRYDKAVRVTNKVRSLQTQDRPLVANEVDWLVVLGQFSTFIPKGASLNGITLSALSPSGAEPGSVAAVARTQSASTAVIGAGRSTVKTGSLTQVTEFGLDVAKAKALATVSLSGAVTSSPTSVTFPIDFAITSAAHTHRLSLFDRRIP